MRKTFSWLTTMSSLLFLLACGGGGGPETAEQTPATEAPAAVTKVDPATPATIKGKVTFDGEKPRSIRLQMDAEAACAALHKEPVYSDMVVLSDNKEVQHTFVYVKDGLEDKVFETAKEPAVLDQKGCIYQPHMLGVQTNQTIKILNSDPTTHNIHPIPEQNREWNESMAPGIPPKEKSFPREEVMIPVKCNVHPWMKSYIGVLKHPFFAVTGTDGSFEIKGLPPGEYTIEAWHELLKGGTTSQKVTVGPSETKTVDFTLKEIS